ncbi:reverse transcriptase [Plakobranchus ocellatus]|uniref:Reverse transcriptase n=1 Tax=Plakobranchus ocellatus TaxID=259542 RepID=A0AAV4BZR2_9GAST|nr:reverse transcriptase [Plakobranchus ocellatus]
MIIDEIRNKEDSTRVQKAVQQPQQGQWISWDTAIQRSLTWNDIWHMAPLRISFLIRSVYDLLPSNAIWCDGKRRTTLHAHCAKGIQLAEVVRCRVVVTRCSRVRIPGKQPRRKKKVGSREASGSHDLDVARPP